MILLSREEGCCFLVHRWPCWLYLVTTRTAVWLSPFDRHTCQHSRAALSEKRQGNRPSNERAYIFFDRSIDVCCRVGFREILLKGDTNFSQPRHLIRWHHDNVQFGFDTIPKLVEAAENLDKTAWKQLHRKQRTSEKLRAGRPNTHSLLKNSKLPWPRLSDA